MNPNPYQLRSAHHNTEAYYQLGLSLRAQGKLDEAYDAFYQAIWDYAFHSAAYYQLAELSCRKQNFTSALEQIEQSLSTNALNIKALNIKAVILRKLKRFEETKQIVVDVLYNTSCYQNLLDQSCCACQAAMGPLGGG